MGNGREHAGTRVLMLIADLDIRIVEPSTGTLIRALHLGASRDYQPTGKDRYARWRT